MENLKRKISKIYLKLLRAYARNKLVKAEKLYKKVLELQLEYTYEKRNTKK